MAVFCKKRVFKICPLSISLFQYMKLLAQYELMPLEHIRYKIQSCSKLKLLVFIQDRGVSVVEIPWVHLIAAQLFFSREALLHVNFLIESAMKLRFCFFFFLLFHSDLYFWAFFWKLNMTFLFFGHFSPFQFNHSGTYISLEKVKKAKKV